MGDYTIELGKADLVQEGTDVTVVGWGAQMRVLQAACDKAKAELGASCELIDLRTLLPWDTEMVQSSVVKTGKLLISHEAPITCGFGAEIAARIQEKCFYSLEAPIARVCGYDIPFPLVYEKIYLPDVLRNFEAIKKMLRA